MWVKDLIGALSLLLIAVGYYTLSGDINPSALDDTLGAAGLPVIYAAALATLALALAAKAVLGWSVARSKNGKAIDGFHGDGHALQRAGVMLGIGVAYIASVTLIGYVPALIAVIALVALYQGERASLRFAAVAGGGAICFWAFFDRLLGVEMPVGFWPVLWGA